MEILGFARMMKTMNKIDSEFENEANKFIKRVGKRFLKKVKIKTPVDTGYLRRSWRTRMGNLSITIGTTVKYAPYVENGHRTKGGKHIEGRYMLKTTIEEFETEIEEELDSMLEILWK